VTLSAACAPLAAKTPQASAVANSSFFVIVVSPRV
jgi:hypothetical protein